MQLTGEVGVERWPGDSSRVETGAGWLDPVTGDVVTQVMTELASMSSLLGRASARRRVGEIQAGATALLRRIAALIMAREIDPWTRLRLSPAEALVSPPAGGTRIGVFPLTANPIHWGHLLSGLSVMANARLDKIVYVITHGASGTEVLYPEEMRREAAAEAIALFQPLFTLVPASAGGSLGGPASFFRLLGLNAEQTVEAFYIADPERGASESTVETLEALRKESGTNGAGRNEHLHPVSVVMLDADGAERPALEHARVRTIPSPLRGISTAEIRSALRSPLHRDELAALPACVFRHLRMLSAFD